VSRRTPGIMCIAILFYRRLSSQELQVLTSHDDQSILFPTRRQEADEGRVLVLLPVVKS